MGGECGSLVYMTFFFTADEIHFICRGKYGLVPTTTSLIKCAKKIRNNPPAKADVAKPVPSLKSGKRGPVICRTNNLA